MFYALTDHHIHHRRLSEQDFLNAAHHKVITRRHSSLLHHDVLVSNFRLTPQQLEERTLDARALLEKDRKKLLGIDFSTEEADASAGRIARSKRSLVEPFLAPRFVSHDLRFHHFQLIRELGFEEAHQSDSPIWQKTRLSDLASNADVLPGLLTEELPLKASSVRQSFRSVAAIIFVHRQISARVYWSLATKISPDLLAHVPSDNFHVLSSDLHKQRRLYQVIMGSPHQASTYYCGLDAALSAFATLRHAKVGQETLEASLHRRYLDMLHSPRINWYAASLEALLDERKESRTPEDYFKTVCTVEEIRIRLAQVYLGENTHMYSSASLQNAVAKRNNFPPLENNRLALFTPSPKEIDRLLDAYRDMRHEALPSQPWVLTTALQKLLATDAFNDRFAIELSTKIVEAAGYFNPAFLFKDEGVRRQQTINRPLLVRASLG